MTAGRHDLIEITALVTAETAKAWRVDHGGKAPVWLAMEKGMI